MLYIHASLFFITISDGRIFFFSFYIHFMLVYAKDVGSKLLFDILHKKMILLQFPMCDDISSTEKYLWSLA